MKVKVLRTFRDKVTGEKRTPGKIIEVTKERAADIMSAGAFIELLEAEEENTETVEAEEENTETVGTEENTDLELMSVAELKKLAIEREIDLSGATKKNEIIEKIRG